ncbi:MAG TPA: hypothetical protein VMH40_18135 [Myxococcaceae bacterium]|nr:hypothetical protein [Myxococcaceae bacterium]
MRLRRLLLPVLLGASAARAHSVSNELALGLSEDTPASPHGPHVADQLTFRFDLADDWVLKLGGTYTYDTATDPPTGGAFGTSSAQILTMVGGLEWDVSPRVNVYLEGSGSPKASQTFDAALPLSTPAGAVLPPSDVLLYNASSSVGLLGGVTFVVGGHEFLGTVNGGLVIDLSLGWTLLTTEQRVDAIVDKQQKPVSRTALLALCKLAPRSLTCRTLKPYLKGGEDSLNQLSVSLALLQPLGPSTDIGLSGSYYGYDQDPTSAVFFTARASTPSDSLGAGFPLAPVRWSVSPSFEQRVGAWSLGPWYQFLQYASGLGQAHVVGLRIQVRLPPAWTLWVSGSAQWDLLSDPSALSADSGSTTVLSGRVAVGFRARF